jgi:hypothetical protein
MKQEEKKKAVEEKLKDQKSSKAQTESKVELNSILKEMSSLTDLIKTFSLKLERASQ